MIDKSIRRSAVIVSYFWEFVGLSSHAERLGRLRILRHQAEEEFRITTEHELASLRIVVESAAHWEEDMSAVLNDKAGEASVVADPFIVGIQHKARTPSMSKASNDSTTAFATGVCIGILTTVVLVAAACTYIARTLSVTRSKLLLSTVLCFGGSALLAICTRSPVWVTIGVLSALAAVIVALAVNGQSGTPRENAEFRIPDFKDSRW